MRYALIWEFRVRDGCEREFERQYGEHGAWATLFARSPGYLGTQLLADEAAGGRYVTVDWWSSVDAFDAFRTEHAEDYEALDARCASLTSAETPFGVFRGS